MFRAYLIKKEFAKIIKTNPSILFLLDTDQFSYQWTKIVESPITLLDYVKQQLQKREDVVVQEEKLLYFNTLTHRCSCLELDKISLNLTDINEFPFLDVLKRCPGQLILMDESNRVVK